jgi:hypothetical protein
MLGVALVLWFGVSFLMGAQLKYRLALEVVAWSSLVGIPGQLISYALAWYRQTFRGIHLGFGILLPDSEAPSRLMTGLGTFLDALGPLLLWHLTVAILGASALSGAPRKSTAWVLGGLYLVLAVFSAALAAMFSRNA